MNYETRYFGEIEFDEKSTIHFDEGLPGFEDKHNFIILNNFDTEEPVPFMWMQCVDDPNLAFVITIPFFMRPDYSFDIPTDICEQLDIASADQVGVYTICRISGSIESMTMNLRNPIIVNSKNFKAMQMMINDERYTTKEVFKNS